MDETELAGLVVDTPLYRQFAEEFGGTQAQALLAAAVQHNNDVHNGVGSDLFRWSIIIAIGYECMEVPRYRKAHGITVPFKQLRQWIKENANLAEHDGDVDYLALAAGAYQQFL